MVKVSLKFIAFPSASEDVFKRGEDLLRKFMPSLIIENSSAIPEILFVLTGGSEFQAKNLIDKMTQVIILALIENNSFAAATEIKAYCNQKNIKSVVINLDTEENPETKFKNHLISLRAISSIQNYHLGLVGNVSNWLIASDIQNHVLKNKFGIRLSKINWNNYPGFSQYNVNNDFIDHFKNSDGFDLKDSSRVYSLLLQIINDNKLDAITVECFPLVREHAVTACLGLSKLNNDSFPAGCEGDLTSITGMIIAKVLTGQIPWMANLISISKRTVLLAHCTIATNLVKDLKVSTHFETNSGTAVQGHFNSEDVTIFRFDNSLEKVFISVGKVISTPSKNDACRTQVEIQIPEKNLNILKEKPLGNHHLILPGNFEEILTFFCNWNNILVNNLSD